MIQKQNIGQYQHWVLIQTKEQIRLENSYSWWGPLGNLDHSLTKDNDYNGYIKDTIKFNFKRYGLNKRERAKKIKK